MKVLITSIILIGFVVSSLAERVTLTEVTFGRNVHSNRYRRAGNSMPKYILFRMEDTQGLITMLKLTKLDLPTTYIVKGGRSSKFFGSSDNIATYKDEAREGVFMLGKRYNQGVVQYDLIGSFQFGKRRVAIKPDPGVEFRNAYQLDEEYGIIDNTGDAIEPPGYVPPQRNNTSNPNPRALLNYIIEVCFLADYAIYQKFLTKNSNDAVATNTEMSTYYAFQAEQLRVRYNTVQLEDPSFSINIVNSGLVIYTDPADVPFVENGKVGSTINSSLVLSQFRTYINNIPAGIDIPPSDHYMLFSGYDLFSGSTGSNSNAGLAYTNVMCTSYVVSLVEDTRRERATITAAHELGHGIGSGHDDNEGCSDADQYIMTAVSGTVTSTAVAIRRWKFSPCSVAAFKLDLEGKTCLSDNRYGDGFLSESPKLGQVYSLDQQCQFAVDESSSYYGVNTGEECFRIQCVTFQNSTNVFYTYVLPLDYTDCGTDLWCVHGECVAKATVEPPANQPPTITNLPHNENVVALSTGTVYTITGTDPENDQVSYSYIWNSPNNAADIFDFNTLTGAVSVKTGVVLDYNTYQGVVFNLTVTAIDDEGGASSSQILTLTVVQDANTPPTITNPPNSGTNTVDLPTLSPTGTVFDVDATDAEGDPITYQVVSWSPVDGGTYFNFNTADGVITATGTLLPPDSTYNLLVRAYDGTDFSTTATVIFNTPSAVNTPPTITNPQNSGTITVDLPTLSPNGNLFDVDATDAEGDPVTYQVVSWSPVDGGTYFNLNTVDGVITATGTPLPPDTTYTLTVRAYDGTDFSTTATVIFNTPSVVNTPPVITNPVNSGSSTVNLPTLSPTGTVFDVDATDAESDPITYPVFSWNPTDAATYFDFNTANGVITAKPGINLPPDSTFTLTVRASDGTVVSTPATVIINTPSAVNTPPTITNPPNSGSTTVNLPTLSPTGTVFDVDATDAESDPITYPVFSWNPTDAGTYFDFNTANGVITAKPGVTLLPDSTYTLTVRASDGTDVSTPATVVFNTPSAVNTPPVIINPVNSGSTTVNLPTLSPTGAVFDVDATDAESDPITYQVVSWNPNDGGTYFDFNTANGVITAKPGINLPPDSTFTLTVRASDGTVVSTPATVIINTPSAPNTPPRIVNPANSGNSIVTVTSLTPTGSIFDFNAVDDENDPISYQVVNWNPSDGATYFDFNSGDGSVTRKPGMSLPTGSTFILTVRASDGNGLSAPASVIINTPANNAPVMTTTSLSANIPITTTGVVETFIATDADNDPLTYTPTLFYPAAASSFFEVNAQTGQVSVKPGVVLVPGFYIISVAANDGKLSSSSHSLSITVEQPANTPPRIVNPVNSGTSTVTLQSLSPVGNIFVFDAVDDENDPISYEMGSWSPISGSFYFNFNTADGTVTAKPGVSLPGGTTFILTVRATDGKDLSQPATITIITPVPNLPPVIYNLPNDATVPENPNGEVFYTVQATDPENDNIVFTETWEPSWASYYFSFDPNTGEVSSKASPKPTYANFKIFVFKLHVTASDGTSTSETKTLTFQMEPPSNTPPEFLQTYYFATVKGRQPGTVVRDNFSTQVTDPDPQDTKTFSIVPSQWSQYFNINPSTGQITYSTTKDLSQLPLQFYINIEVTDGAGAKDTTLLFINILPNNLPGFPNLPQTISIPEGNSPSNVFTVQPPVSTPLTYSMTQSPMEVPFSINPTTGAISYVGSTSIDYESLTSSVITLKIKATDGSGTSTPEETLTINIQDINEPPVFNNPAYSVTVNAGLTGQTIFTNLQASVNDPDLNDVVTFQLLPGQYADYFYIDAKTGTIRYAKNTIGVNLPSPVRLTVMAKDRNGLSSTTYVDVTIAQTNNEIVILNLPASKQISNSQASGVPIYDVNAEGSNLIYSIQNGNLFPQWIFQIDPSSGAVSIRSGLNIGSFELDTIKLQIGVTDGSQTVTETLTIVVGSSPDNQPPVFSAPYYFVKVNDGTAGAFVINAGSATDPDGDSLTYQINLSKSGTAGSLFNINPNTGDITFKEDYYLKDGRPSQVGLTITATDTGGLSADVLVFITIMSPLRFENLPSQTIIVRSQVTNPVYKVKASGGNPALSYRLEDNLGAFYINPQSGDVSVNYSLLSTGSHDKNLRVVVTDANGQSVIETLRIVIF